VDLGKAFKEHTGIGIPGLQQLQWRCSWKETFSESNCATRCGLCKTH